MPKLEIAISAQSSRFPGRVYLDTPYDPALIAKIKSFPGAEWRPSERQWLFPVECIDLLGEPVYRADKKPETPADLPSLNPALYKFQQKAVRAALQQTAYLLAMEMGTGKTAVAIECLRLKNYSDILIVCPAFVRTTWEDEFEKWWPDKKHIHVITTGKTEPRPGINIVSYELLHKAVQGEWEVIILDESTAVKNSRSLRSKQAKRLCDNNPGAFKLLLTGTPIDTEPGDLHHQLDIMHPGRWGKFWSFVNAYSIVFKHQYGIKISGVNELRAQELAQRLKAVSIRITKKEVRHFLPPYTINIIRMKNPGGVLFNQRAISELLGSGLRKQHEVEAHIERAGSKKDDTVVELTKAAIESGEHNIIILTHLKSTAVRVAGLIRKNTHRGAVVITGELPEVERRAQIRDATAAGAVIVATMHSIGIGINELAQYTTMIFSELYWRPLIIVQALGRLNRLSSKLPSNVYIPIVEGSLDEPIAAVLKRRLHDAEQLYEPGAAETELADGFDRSDEDWSQELQSALTFRLEDAYL